jgi:Na+/melibiose symporter-like transporter
MWGRWQGGVWQRRNFRRLWAAQTVSEFGTLISRTAIPFAAVLVLDASPLELSVIGVCEMLPAFVLGLFAGAWVDRLPRRPIMMVADLGRAALLAVIPLLAWLDQLTIHALWIVAALVSALTVFFDVAYRSILPSILPADELMEGNSRLTASASVAEFGAFSLGGWLVQLFSAPGAVLIDSFTFIWSALWLRGLKMSEQVKSEEARLPILQEIRDGIHLVWRNRTLRALAGYAATFEFAFNMFGAVFLIFLVREVGFSPGGLGVIFAIGGLSSIAGAAMASRVTSALGLQRTIVVMSIIMAVGQGMVAFAMTVSVVSVGLLLLQQGLVDAPYTIVDVNTATIRQTSASEEWQGRLNATFRVLAFGGALLGTVAGGIIGEFIGLRVALVIASLVIAGSALWARDIARVESASAG